MKVTLKKGDRGRVILTYQKNPVSRSFYSSGGYVFEDLPTGDRIMTTGLQVCEGALPALRATLDTLAKVLRKECQNIKP